jgi:hypothetical protein
LFAGVELGNSDHDDGLHVSQGEIERMTAAAAVIRECRRDLAARNSDILKELTAAGAVVSDWRHYPEGDVYDPSSHAQYFFHAHPGDSRPALESGHFHTFLRPEGMPPGVAPLLLPELAVADVAALPPQAAPIKRGARDEVSHLVAIAIDVRGEPVRLFTTNRWVTGETWYRADDVILMLDRFSISEMEPSDAVNRWVGAMIQLFRPQIGALLRVRDATVMAWRRRRRTHVFEDPRLEVTSSLEITLDAQLAFIDGSRSNRAETASRRVPGLPSMAEGWEQNHPN